MALAKDSNVTGGTSIHTVENWKLLIATFAVKRLVY
jgi:hypothetical protein